MRLSLFILFFLSFCFSSNAQFGAISAEIDYDASIKNHFLYKDSILIPKDTLIEPLDDFAYFDEFVYDSLTPGLYTLIVYLTDYTYEDNIDFY